MLIGLHAIALALILVMRFAPRSPAGRLLHRQLVEQPLRRLARVERHHLIFIALMGVLVMFGSEALMAMGGLDLAAVYMIDVSLYLDAAVVTLALSALDAVRLAGNVIVLPVARLRRGRRARRVRIARRAQRRASNDDDPVPARLAA